MNARVFILDNVDSFTYNLAQAFMKLGAEVRVHRTLDTGLGTRDLLPLVSGPGSRVPGRYATHLILSPGPLRPSDHPMNFTLLDQYAGKLPILGVCLGMQAINEWCGGTIRKDTPPMHGKTSEVRYAPGALLLDGLPNPFTAARYHSLVVDRLGKALRATAWTSDPRHGTRDSGLTAVGLGSRVPGPGSTIMALAHDTLPLFGVQFHPESYLTPDGERMLQQFLRV